MKYTEEQFKTEVVRLYEDRYELVSRYKGLTKPILVKNKYGVLNLKEARTLLTNEPTILKALNKTEYFMNVLKEKCPDIYKELTPESEYQSAKEKMLFNTKFGLVSISPDALLAGHMPNIRSSVNRKQYFYNMLKDIYKDEYDFIITDTDRKNGRSILICNTHGEVDIDNEYIFQGKGCPKCILQTESNVFYLIKLTNDEEWFYKLGISYINSSKQIRRYSDYRTLGYSIEIIKEIEFDSSRDCKDLELKLKQLIKNNTYVPKKWPHESSTECFKEDLLDLILKNL